MPYINIITGQSSNTNPGGSNAGWVPVSGGGGGSSGGGSSGGGGGSNNIANPGSVYQTYNPNTGQTTYGTPPPGYYSSTQSGPPVGTPGGTPVGAYVYQGHQSGFAPSGPTTNFGVDARGNVINSQYSQNPSAFPDIKTDTSLSSSDTKLSDTAATLKSQNDTLKATQEAQNLGSLKDRVLSSYKSNPNGVANNAFIQAAAQAAFGRAATKEELAKGGQFGLQGLSVAEVTRRFGLAPVKEGATEYPPTQVEPAPEIATDDGLIDLQKAIASFEAQLIAAQNEEIQAQQNLDTFTNETQRGVNAIGQELGRTATLVQGEQYALKQQRQADEDLLVKRLGIAEKKKANVIEQGRLKMEIEQKIYERKRQIVEDARKLRKDQQETLAASFEMMLKYGIGADKNGNFSPSTLKLVNSFSSSTGIPSGMYLDMLNAAHNDKLNNNIEIYKTNKGRNNYLTRIDKTTGKIISETFIGSDPAPSGGGGSDDPFKNVLFENGTKYTDYQDDLRISISNLAKDRSLWQQEWDTLQGTYGVPTDVLWDDLGRDKFAPKTNEKVSTYNKVKNWWENTGIPAKKRQGKSAISK